jgi:hypothetical protein
MANRRTKKKGQQPQPKPTANQPARAADQNSRPARRWSFRVSCSARTLGLSFLVCAAVWLLLGWGLGLCWGNQVAWSGSDAASFEFREIGDGLGQLSPELVDLISAQRGVWAILFGAIPALVFGVGWLRLSDPRAKTGVSAVVGFVLFWLAAVLVGASWLTAGRGAAAALSPGGAVVWLAGVFRVSPVLYWLAGMAVFALAALTSSVAFLGAAITCQCESHERLPLVVYGSGLACVLCLLLFSSVAVQVTLAAMDLAFGWDLFVDARRTVDPHMASHGGGQFLIWRHWTWLLGFNVQWLPLPPVFGGIGDLIFRRAGALAASSNVEVGKDSTNVPSGNVDVGLSTSAILWTLVVAVAVATATIQCLSLRVAAVAWPAASGLGAAAALGLLQAVVLAVALVSIVLCGQRAKNGCAGAVSVWSAVAFGAALTLIVISLLDWRSLVSRGFGPSGVHRIYDHSDLNYLSAVRKHLVDLQWEARHDETGRAAPTSSQRQQIELCQRLLDNYVLPIEQSVSRSDSLEEKQDALDRLALSISPEGADAGDPGLVSKYPQLALPRVIPGGRERLAICFALTWFSLLFGAVLSAVSLGVLVLRDPRRKNALAVNASTVFGTLLVGWLILTFVSRF